MISIERLRTEVQNCFENHLKQSPDIPYLFEKVINYLAIIINNLEPIDLMLQNFWFKLFDQNFLNNLIDTCNVTDFGGNHKRWFDWID